MKSNIYITFFVCFVSVMVGGTVSTLMSTYLHVAVNDLLGRVDEQKFNNISSLISALFLYGWMFGGIAWGIICDRFGRRWAVILSTVFYGLFTVLTGMSTNWFWISVCRFLSGFGVGGVLLTTNVLIAELWPAKKRAVALGILSVSFPIGIFLAGLIEYSLQWRQAFSIGLVPLVLTMLSFKLIAESMLWKENRQVLPQRHVRPADPHFRQNLFVGTVIFGAMLIGMWATFSWLPTWVQSIAHRGEAQHERGISMMLIGIGGLTGGFISGWVVNIFGLKRTMILCFAGCFIMAFLLFKINDDISPFVYPGIAVLAIFFGISQGALSLYIPELFATAVRAYATGICFNIGRLFTATIVFFIGALVNILGGYGNSIFVFSFVFLAGMLAVIFSPKKATAHF